MSPGTYSPLARVGPSVPYSGATNKVGDLVDVVGVHQRTMALASCASPGRMGVGGAKIETGGAPPGAGVSEE